MIVLFIGDVVGRPGRRAVQDHLDRIVDRHRVDFTIVNIENAADGNGITPEHRYPDFVAIARGFHWQARHVSRKADLTSALQEMIDSPEPYLLDVQVPYQEHVMPMIPAGMTVRDLIKE